MPCGGSVEAQKGSWFGEASRAALLSGASGMARISSGRRRSDA